MSAANRIIYNVDDSSQYAYVESVTEDANTANAILTLSNVSLISGNSIEGTLLSGESFVCDIYSDMKTESKYISNRGLLNGGPMATIPDGYLSWDDPTLENAALALVDPDNTDRMQDSYYYQLFSYVIRTDLAAELYDDAMANLLKLCHPAGFKVFLESI